MSRLLVYWLPAFAFVLVLAAAPAAKASDGPEIVGKWEAQADPPKTTWTLPKARTPKIVLRDHPILNPGMFGPADSPYFSMFGDFLGEQVLRVYDLRDDKLLFEAKVKGMLPPLVLPSYDGKHVAALRREPREAVVFSTANGQQLATVPLDTTVARLAFISPGELLILQARQNQARVVAATTGEEQRRIDLGFPIAERNPFAITPGGRYLLMTGRDRRQPWKLYVFELATGRRVGEVDLPEQFDAFGDGGLALDVSPDGREVAVLNLRKPVLVSLDLNDGKTLTELEVPRLADRKQQAQYDRAKWGYGGDPLAFVPDRNGWLLYGHLFLDRRSGELTFKVPYAEFGGRTGPYRFVGADRLLLLLPDRSSVTTAQDSSFAVVDW